MCPKIVGSRESFGQIATSDDSHEGTRSLGQGNGKPKPKYPTLLPFAILASRLCPHLDLTSAARTAGDLVL